MKRMTTTAIALASMALATPISAATDSGASVTTGPKVDVSGLCDKGFVQSDTNGDNSISRSEYDASRSASFGAMDANGDGTLSRSEYVQCLNQSASSDTPDTLKPDSIDTADADNSGSVDTNEYATATHQARQDAQNSDSPDGVLILRRYIFVPASMDDQQVRDMSEEETAARAAQRFQTLDKDQSGDISQEEWSDAESMKNDLSSVLNMNYDSLDTDESGSVSREEYDAAGKKDWDAAQSAMNTGSDSSGSSDSTKSGSEQSAAASDTGTNKTPEAPGTRGSGGDRNPPVVYFRYFAPIDAG